MGILTIMGKPSPVEPWGWQFQGPHAIVNLVVLGDQVVMTPLFLGSEPTRADSGEYKGLAVLQKEQNDLDYAGLRVKELAANSRQSLRELVQLYVSNMDEGHARVKMNEVDRHLDDTWFAWIGGIKPDSVFYYRIQSPVILVEFDHQPPATLDKFAADPDKPTRQHIHCVVRTPNGNDYGSDLLRQHYLAIRIHLKPSSKICKSVGSSWQILKSQQKERFF